MQTLISKPRAGSSRPAPSFKRPLTVRVAMFSARHPWLVAGMWFMVMVGLMVGSIAAGGTKSADPGSNGPTQLEYARAASVFAQATKTEPGEDFYLLISSMNQNSNLKASDPAFRQVVTQVTNKLKETSYSANGQSSPLFRQVVDLYSVPPTAGLISPDQTTILIYGVVPGEDKEIKARLEVLKPVVKDLKAQFPGYQVLAINHSWINQDVTKNILDELDGSLKITIPLTFLFLLVAFGAVGASVVPLITAMTALLGAFGLMGFYSQLIDPVDVSTSSLIVLIGLAVAVDYSLFMITRFRSEKRRGRSKLEALEIASSTAGRAVFFSGLTVMISLAGLLTIQGSSFHSIAAGTIAVVLLSVVASLTFLPALLSIMNNKVNFLRLPYLGRDREEGSGFWSKLVQAVMHRPVISGAIVLIIVLVMSYPLLNLRLGQVGTEGLPQKSEGIQALNFQKTKWPQGLDLTVNTVVTGADRAETKAAMAKYIEAGLKLPGLGQPVKTVYSPDGTVARISMTMGGEVNDEANFALVRKLRSELVPTYLKNIPGVEAYVGGDTATSLDIKQIFTEATPTVFAFVLGLSFLLLMLVFRSVVIPVKAIILNLLSTGAAYGMLVLVFQEGWFNDWLDIKASTTIASSVPLFVFTVLFGLSMDYHMFILTRVKEGRDQGLNTREAVAHGISTTSGTITSAASIMVMVFAVFVTLHYATVRQLGLGLAVAVFVDAAFIRSILLPASMELLGEWNWYLPRFLNWLPRFQIELEPAPVLANSSVSASSQGEKVA